MALAYLNAGAVELPNVRAVEVVREPIGETARTAGGQLRRDIVTVKRVWQLECVYLTQQQYRAIIDYLDSILWGQTTFWLDSFGGTAAQNSVAVFVDPPERDERVQFGSDGTWHSDGRHLTLVVREV